LKRVSGGIAVVVASAGIWVLQRYAVSPGMSISLDEVGPGEYAEDPALRSAEYGQYGDRFLRLFRRSDTRFDFVFEPRDHHAATVAIRDVDVGLMTPGEPAWTKGDAVLEGIALSERQWTRQQVSFPAGSPHLTVQGGDGFEEGQLYSAELAKGGLGAGRWEVLLYSKENGAKALYYQGWFTFPLGHYKHVFEHKTGLSYLDHWQRLERWQSPAGQTVSLGRLRAVVAERQAPATMAGDDPLLMEGEQARKRKNVQGHWLRTWKDLIDGRSLTFASLVVPGRYDARQPWGNEYGRLATLTSATVRDVRPRGVEGGPGTTGQGRTLAEVELAFAARSGGDVTRVVASGIDLAALPAIEPLDYPQGLYAPMGIGVPPFGEAYADLERRPPERSLYFSMMLDAGGRWLDHRKIGIDGVVMHRDQTNGKLLHVYLLGYERALLVNHLTLTLDGTRTVARGAGATPPER
jgi:hypothetical protein